jgi:hypothetical protein
MWLGVCPQPYDYKQAHVEHREMGQSWITPYPAKAARRVHGVKRPGTFNDAATANSPLASAAIGCNCFASTGLNTTLMAKTTNDAQTRTWRLWASYALLVRSLDYGTRGQEFILGNRR